MGIRQSSTRSWGSLLALLAGSVVSAGIAARSVNAEGVMLGGASIASGFQPAGSVVDAFAGIHYQPSAAADAGRRADQARARPATLRERAEGGVTGDIFRHSRLALPLLTKSTVGDADDAVRPAADTRAMKGPMVGLKPHPRTWGSMLEP